jgi:transcriptional regulator with XRE-family HTH domain
MARGTQYQSVFIQVSAPPGSDPHALAILVEMVAIDLRTPLDDLPEHTADDVRRHELGTFLRSRRERVTPQQVGLPPSRRRRTPGLRREEVAQLAGVGVTWYTWLEQGREIKASPQVLHAIARALQLDMHEHAHLLTLGGAPPDNGVAGECQKLSPTAQILLDRLEPYPACIVNARYDLLGFNRVYASGFPGLDDIPIEDRNALLLLFTHPSWRKGVLDWEDAAARMVAQFRAALAEHLAEPSWKALVARLHRSSPEFTSIWEQHDVRGMESQTKRFLHPLVGELLVDYTYLWLAPRLGARMVTYTPANAATGRRLERLQQLLDAKRSDHAA